MSAIKYMEADGVFVYFIQVGQRGPIKIGITQNVRARLWSLQSGSPDELRLLGAVPGGVKLERSLHRLFKADHIRGEWFRPSKDVRRWGHLFAAIDGRHPEEVAGWQIREELRPRLATARLLPRGSLPLQPQEA